MYIYLVVHLFGDLNTTDGTEGLLQVTVDGELTGGDETDHGKTGTNTGVGSLKTELLGDLDETGGGSLSWCTLGLVDLGKHGVGWLGDNGSGETGHQTGTEVDTGLGSVGELGLVDVVVDDLNALLEDDELGHGVWNLLEQEWSETSVERSNTLVLEHLGETTDQTVGVSWLRDETDTGSLKWAKGDISEELGAGGGSKVDGSAVVGCVLGTDEADGLGLEELVTSELEGTLEEVTSGGWTETGEKGRGTLLGDDLAESTDQATVVGDWVKLDAGLDDIDWSESTMGDGAAQSTGEGESGVKINAGELLLNWGLDSCHCELYEKVMGEKK